MTSDAMAAQAEPRRWRFPEMARLAARREHDREDLAALDARLFRLMTRRLPAGGPPPDPIDHDCAADLVERWLGVTEGRATELLRLVEREGLLAPVRGVWCDRGGGFLATFPAGEALPEKIACPYHTPEQAHGPDELEVEVLFRFTPKAAESAGAVALCGVEETAPPRCGDDCLCCSGEACRLCGAGCWSGRTDCEHDVIERHREPRQDVQTL